VVEDSQPEQSNQSNQSNLSNPANQSGLSSNPDESSVSSKEEVSSKVPSSNIDSSSAPSSSIDSSSATPPVEKPYLKITQPKNQKFSTKSSSVTFKGSTNIATGVTINGNPIKMPRSIDGAFTVTEKLKYGNNKFVFKAGDITKTYNIYRQYTVIKDYSHKNGKSYNSGATFTVTVTARAKATVKATFNGKTITLKTASTTKNNDFVEFKGKFTLPTKNTKNLNVGKVKYTATYTDFTDTFYSGNITCLKDKTVISTNSSVTPNDNNYINVGSGLITEIVAPAETFDGKGTKDTSKPYYNYLPKGTVDYGSANMVTMKRDGDTYKLITLRCGKKVYQYRYDKPPKTKVAVSKQYVGTLPDHNELKILSFKQSASHTVLTLDTMWKAPFDFKLKNQSYNGDYTVDSITYTYLDIRFCYATKFTGTISVPKNHPLFSKAKIIKNKYDYTLRLYLKKQGAFYGWDAYYNSKNQLVFEFLNPAKITLKNNKYGADLTGVKILIDVGHGGIDPGTSRSSTRKNCEAARNLYLAKKIRTELKSIGATVYMTRTEDVTSTADDKTNMLRKIKPDYCIAIHHDSNDSSSLNGVGVYYYYPFSKTAAKYVLDASYDTGIYKNKRFKWHYYYTSRVSVCPVVLTENGYYSNNYDYNNIISNTKTDSKAVAITKGIVKYFKSIQ
jgi:N-acetylmuramoyl-L-alanine amidase